MVANYRPPGVNLVAVNWFRPLMAPGSDRWSYRFCINTAHKSVYIISGFLLLSEHQLESETVPSLQDKLKSNQSESVGMQLRTC